MSEGNPIIESFKYNVLIMKICGIYPPDAWPEWRYKMYGYFSYFTITVLFPILAIINLIVGEIVDIHQTCWSIVLAIETGALIVKAFVFVQKPEKVKKTRNDLAKDIFNSYTQDQEYIIKDTIKEYYTVFIAISTFSIASFFASFSLIFFSPERTLPINLWLPFDGFTDTRIYVGVLIYVALGNGHGCCQNFSLDTMIVGMIFQSAAQVRILKNNLEFLGDNVEKEIRSQGELSEPEDELRSKLVYRNICQCVEHYQSIFEYTRDIEGVYSMVIFAQLFSSITIICILLLELSLVVPFTFQFFSTLIFVITMLTQIFLFCYYGTILSRESETVNTAIYMSQWYNYDKKSKKSLFTLMERAKRPIKVTAGKFFDLSLDTFTSILRKSYSLLAVLKNYY
ncbi:unnamed protein product [Phaedon cochleariae]|uniref:Odorant receptor n=1 Tax=Phaedon cochleariae TaxID=80249 RepID=A0A9P0DVE2_PHACE|nr:unnamed protein product [Phaedon cochleariae]